jgi:hypothetical protein
VGNKEWSEKLDFEDMIVRLPVNDEYPPRDKVRRRSPVSWGSATSLLPFDP